MPGIKRRAQETRYWLAWEPAALLVVCILY